MIDCFRHVAYVHTNMDGILLHLSALSSHALPSVHRGCSHWFSAYLCDDRMVQAPSCAVSEHTIGSICCACHVFHHVRHAHTRAVCQVQYVSVQICSSIGVSGILAAPHRSHPHAICTLGNSQPQQLALQGQQWCHVVMVAQLDAIVREPKAAPGETYWSKLSDAP